MEKGSLLSQFQAQGFLSSETKGAPFERLYLIKPSPTVEALARHWHNRLQAKIEQHSKGKTALRNVRVYETPNIYADYSLLFT